MIDLHCHLLPGIDDGAQTEEESIGLLQQAIADGITHMVLTSHVQPGRYNNNLNNLQIPFQRLQEIVKERQLTIKLSLGGEVRLCDEILQLFADDLQGTELCDLALKDLDDIGRVRVPRAQTPEGDHPPPAEVPEQACHRKASHTIMWHRQQKHRVTELVRKCHRSRGSRHDGHTELRGKAGYRHGGAAADAADNSDSRRLVFRR